jgi:glucose-6-phosphate isomerase
MQDWVGGRFSVWSACGIPIAIAHGVEAFETLLAGAAEMDRHHASAPLMRNGPIVLALLDAWNGNFLGCSSRAVFPYSQRLRALVGYLQQLEMESGGKRTDLDGRPVDYPTARVVWGEAGTVAQHSVFQFLHQGTETVPCEFIAVATHRAGTRRERLLTDFAVAQADALAFGDSALPQALRPEREWARCEGSRPSVLLWLDDLSARALGSLLALNEHRTAARAVLWNINAFDQWGVEIGKRLLKARGAR